MGRRGARPTRRDLLAGAVGGVTGLAAGAGLESFRRTSVTGASLGNDPVLLGRASDDVPAGVVRADLRAFHSGSGSDYHDAFVAALEAADAVYVPPGIWGTSDTIEVGAGKVLWSDAAYDRPTVPVQGAIVRATQSMGATVRLTEPGATITSVVVDGADSAEAALEVATDEVQLNNASARRGQTYALKAVGERCTIWGGLFQQTGSNGYAMYQEGADTIMWGARVKRGQVPLWIAGSGGMYGVLHVTGVAGGVGGSSAATVKVTGPRNTLVDVFYDTAVGPSLLLADGASSNHCIGMNVRNRYSGGKVPVIRCDATSGQVLNNFFDGFFTDDAGGDGWTALLELLGHPNDLTGTILGDGHADHCASIWNTRPTAVGNIVSNGKLVRNAGAAALAIGAALLRFPHGLKGTPRSVTITLSDGSQASPSLSVDEEGVVCTWPAPASRPVTVYWRAEL